MDIKTSSDKQCFNNDPIDIFVLRILAKEVIKNIPLFFNFKSGMLSPVDICIINGFIPDIFEKELAAILLSDSIRLNNLIKMDAPTDMLLKTNQKIMEQICSLKPNGNDNIICIENVNVILPRCIGDGYVCCGNVNFIIKYKVFLVLKHISGKLSAILIPDDEGTGFCFDSSMVFPVEYNFCGIKEKLDIDKVNKWLILNITIPLDTFDDTDKLNPLSGTFLQPKLTVDNVSQDYDLLLNFCSCNNSTGTHAALKITADITSRIGTKQDILIKGSPGIGF